MPDLRRQAVAPAAPTGSASSGIFVKAFDFARIIVPQPARIVGQAAAGAAGMAAQLHPVEAAVGARLATAGSPVLEIVGVRGRFEMRLAQQRRAIPVLAQICRQIGCVLGQRDAVRCYAMAADILPGQNGRACGHADGVLVARLTVIQPVRRQAVDGRRPRHLAARAAQRIMALLVRGDQ